MKTKMCAAALAVFLAACAESPTDPVLPVEAHNVPDSRQYGCFTNLKLPSGRYEYGLIHLQFPASEAPVANKQTQTLGYVVLSESREVAFAATCTIPRTHAASESLYRRFLGRRNSQRAAVQMAPAIGTDVQTASFISGDCEIDPATGAPFCGSFDPIFVDGFMDRYALEQQLAAIQMEFSVTLTGYGNTWCSMCTFSGPGGGGDGTNSTGSLTKPANLTDQEWNDLTEAEKLLALRYWYEVRDVNAAKLAAEAFSANSGLCGPRDGPQDAVRHAHWNAGMTVRIGSESAKRWGDAHEAGKSGPDVEMDLCNNGIGRVIGQETGSLAGLDSAVLNAYASNRLYWITQC